MKRRVRRGGFRCEVGPSFVAAAVAAGALSVAPTALPLSICIIACAAAAGGMFWGCGTVHRQPSVRACAAAALLGAMLAATGVLRLRMEERSAHFGLAEPGPLVLHGSVLDDSRPVSRGGTALSLHVSSVSRPGGSLKASADVRMEILLRDAESFHRGEVLSAALQAPPESWRGGLVGRPVRVERHGFLSPFWRLRAALRERVVAALARAGPAAGLATAVLIGDRRYLDPAVVARFRRAGASHLLALSGLHVGIVYGCVLVLMRVAPRRAGPLVAAAVAAGYALIATGGPALARAAMMASVGSLLAVADRERRPVPIIALAALILLTIDPGAAAQLSFQLSFLALLGVLAGARVAARMPPGLSPLGGRRRALLGRRPSRHRTPGVDHVRSALPGVGAVCAGADAGGDGFSGGGARHGRRRPAWDGASVRGRWRGPQSGVYHPGSRDRAQRRHPGHLRMNDDP